MTQRRGGFGDKGSKTKSNPVFRSMPNRIQWLLHMHKIQQSLNHQIEIEK